MEISFSQLKQKEVINLTDGKNLGKVCDLTFVYPENKVLGITVTGCKGFKFTKHDMFIPMNCIVKIGEDAILVKVEDKGGKNPPDAPCPPPQNNCPPGGRPPKCPPPQNNCPPGGRPPVCPPPQNNFPPYPSDRRSYDEYE